MILAYRVTCPRCRAMSFLAVAASTGRVVRVPLGELRPALLAASGSAAAELVPADAEARPAFWDGTDLHVGASVWPAVRRAVLRRWLTPWR
ncbi:MAG: hypothetical protein JWP95_1078 [Actinotalea sp.]|nr:hypothetical protein [Actinotalea sp.]